MLSEAAWVGIFSHELAHCQRRDHRASLLAELLVILMPWNPLAWRMKRRLGYLAERTCDDWVLHAGQPAADYAETLLQLVPQRGPTLALAAVSGRQTLKARIRKILHGRHRKPVVSPWWSALAGTATAAAVVLIAFAQAATENTMPPNDEPITLSGHVVAADGRPLAGAPMVVMTCPWLMTLPEKLAVRAGFEVFAQGTTTKDGRFELRVDPHTRDCPGQQMVQVRPPNPLPLHIVAAAAGHGLGWLPVSYPLQDQAGLRLCLPPEQLIRGRLIDLQGLPAANVRLEVIGVGSVGSPVGGYYPNEPNTVMVLLARTRRLDQGTWSFDLDSERAKGIQFWSAPKDLPTWPAAVMTDTQGGFVLRGIAPEQEIGLVVRDERYAYQMLHIGPRGGLRSPITFALPPPRFIDGMVTDEQTGEPVANAHVYAEANWIALQDENQFSADWKGRGRRTREEIGALAPVFGGFGGIQEVKLPNLEARTDGHGHFRIQVYQPPQNNENPFFVTNRFVVWVHGPDRQAYLDVGKVFSWPKGAALQRNVDIALPRGVLVRGQVTEDRTGQAIAGARVDCWSKGFTMPRGVLPPGPIQTGRDGVFQVALPPTHWHLLVNGPGSRRWNDETNGTGFLEEPIEIARLTEDPGLLKARKPNAVQYKEIGREPSYYPDAWLALDLKPGDPPQALGVMLHRKQPVLLTSKSLP